MSNLDISPEEILKMREEQSGMVYDDPMEDEQVHITEQTISAPMEKQEQPIFRQPEPIAIKEQEQPIFRQHESVAIKEQEQPIFRQPEPVVNLGNINDGKIQPEPITSFGKAQSYVDSPSFDLGWKNLPVGLLPSKGMFYPEGTKIAIRAAEVKEIRHFSAIDEDDRLDIEEKLGYVIDRCLRMDYPGEGVVSFKDLIQEDRFFAIMAIRDLTFISGENSIILMPKTKCENKSECPFSNGIELRTGGLRSYELEDRIVKYYNPTTRSFVFDVKKIGKSIEMTVPTIGINSAISDFVVYCSARNIDIDEGFLEIAPFILKEWRGLTNEKILMRMRESDYWSKEEYSLYFGLSEKIKIGTEIDVKQVCPVCGKEVTADIAFPSGLRSLFVISDIFRELLGD
jgi:hypothetical protein